MLPLVNTNSCQRTWDAQKQKTQYGLNYTHGQKISRAYQGLPYCNACKADDCGTGDKSKF